MSAKRPHSPAEQDPISVRFVDDSRRLWSIQESKTLLRCYKDLLYLFRDPFKKPRENWTKLAVLLNSRGFVRSSEECNKKFRNMKQTFKTIHLDHVRSVESKYQWEFYGDMLDIFKEETEAESLQKLLEPDCVQTRYVITAQPSGGEEAAMAALDEKLNVEMREQGEEGTDLVTYSIESPEPEAIQADAANEAIMPVWFEEYAMNFEGKMNLMQETLNKIVGKLELNATMIQNLSMRLNRLEKKAKSE